MRDFCMSKGIGRLLADDTTAQVSGEILVEPINNKEMELYKDREKGKAVRTFTLTFTYLTSVPITKNQF